MVTEVVPKLINDYAKTWDKVYWTDTIPWVVMNGILSPIAMPHLTNQVDRKKVRQILAESNALLATWSSQWDSEPSEWWWTICDSSNYSVETIENARGRRSVRKGLKHCEVKTVTAGEFAAHAYPIQLEALTSYGAAPEQLPNFEAYDRAIRAKGEYEGTTYWGAFFEGKMVAFSTCFAYDEAVILGTTKSLGDYDKYNPNSALFYEITRYYLTEAGLRYVSNGSRNLLHPTTINDFLERMGFRKAYCRLNVELSSKAKLVKYSKVNQWGKLAKLDKMLPGAWHKIEGFQKLLTIEQSFDKAQP